MYGMICRSLNRNQTCALQYVENIKTTLEVCATGTLWPGAYVVAKCCGICSGLCAHSLTCFSRSFAFTLRSTLAPVGYGVLRTPYKGESSRFSPLTTDRNASRTGLAVRRKHGHLWLHRFGMPPTSWEIFSGHLHPGEHWATNVADFSTLFSPSRGEKMRTFGGNFTRAVVVCSLAEYRRLQVSSFLAAKHDLSYLNGCCRDKAGLEIQSKPCRV